MLFLKNTAKQVVCDVDYWCRVETYLWLKTQNNKLKKKQRVVIKYNDKIKENDLCCTTGFSCENCWKCHIRAAPNIDITKKQYNSTGRSKEKEWILKVGYCII